MRRGIHVVIIGLAGIGESYGVTRRLLEAKSIGGLIVIDDFASMATKEVDTLAESLQHRRVGRSELTMELTPHRLINTIAPLDLKKINEHPFEKFMSGKHRRKHRY